MRDMDGLALVRELRRRFPDVRSVCISGFDDFRFVGPAINEGGVSGYILKPVRVDEMRGVLRRILAELDRVRPAGAPEGDLVARVGMDAKNWRDGLDEAALSRPVRIARTALPPPAGFFERAGAARGRLDLHPARGRPPGRRGRGAPPTRRRCATSGGAYLQLSAPKTRWRCRTSRARWSASRKTSSGI